MADDTPEAKPARTPKPLREVQALVRIDALLEPFSAGAVHRILFYFADRAGVLLKQPNGNGEHP